MAADLVDNLVVLMADLKADSMAVLKADSMEYPSAVHSAEWKVDQ